MIKVELLKGMCNMEQNRNELGYKGAKIQRYYMDGDRYIEINAGDLNFPHRLEEVRQRVLAYQNNLKKKYGINSIDELGTINTGDYTKDVEELYKTDQFIKEQLNYAFQYDVSTPAFGSASCLSPSESGEMEFELFYNAVINVVEATFGQRLEKFKRHIKKYTDKKNIHPALRK